MCEQLLIHSHAYYNSVVLPSNLVKGAKSGEVDALVRASKHREEGTTTSRAV